MRYRALTATGDFPFGQGSSNFLSNSPATVAQAVLTRLKLLAGEWFLDTTEGLAASSQILGRGTLARYDQAIRTRVLGTQGVTAITAYQSTLTSARSLTVTMTISTVYGEATVSTSLNTQ